MRTSSFHAACVVCIICLCVLVARCQEECDNEVDLQLLQVDLQEDDAVKAPGLLDSFFKAQSAVPLAQFRAVGEGLQQLASKLGNATASQRAWEALLYAANSQTVAPRAEFTGAGSVLHRSERAENLSLEQSQAVVSSMAEAETSAAQGAVVYILLGVAALLLLGACIAFTARGTKFTESEQNKAFLQPGQTRRTQRKECC
eukprot:TRINITY_DN103153_c0_g1_i1.p1 TRINITY_DN103153_c0_g1~~TRINITY_DN103153_c0_g1_i1.p1  ORF type:complete len:201 (+),score=32.55 TRINITY_DN103153_c0_g1_i1:90-692(+)